MTSEKRVFAESLKVLLVDDNIVDRKLLEFVLAKTPSNISEFKTAKNFEDTLKVLGETDIDVVVLDLNLPDSRGIDTLVKLTEMYPRVAVVVNTGAYEDDLGLMTVGMGAQDFIVKGRYKAYGLIKAIHYAKERKRIEIELKSAYTRIHEAQAQLIQAEKMNVVGRLASGVAHEVKNPLATILFGVAYLNEKIKSSDEKVKMTLHSMTESAKKANNIIKDLLDFSSLSKIDKDLVDVNLVVTKALSLTKHNLDKNCIKVTRELPENLPKVNIDVNRIEQVLINLVLNSISAMPDKGELTVRTFASKASENLSLEKKEEGEEISVVVVEIEDSGQGIPDEIMDKIFDPFFTTRRGAGGVGLGLSVVSNIIDMHDGKITLRNNAKGGATATLIFKI